MIVLVIGQQGQLARSLAEREPPSGMRVVTLGRPQVDLLKPESLVQALGAIHPDIVVNAAAYTAVDKAETEPELAFAVNADGPAHLALACAARDIPIIHVSTDYVFDGSKAAPYVESDAVNAISAYGRSKLAGEQKLARANARHIILRTAWVHSPFGTNFVKTMLRLGATRPEIGVVDDQYGNPTYAPHLAAAILSVATLITHAAADDPRWGMYHAVGSGDATWFGLAQEVFACAGAFGLSPPELRPITSADYPTPAARPANSRLDTARLTRTFGTAFPPWADGVADCVRRLAEATNGSRKWWLEPTPPQSTLHSTLPASRC
jgi:dTDP-4-dehydrorhamnose reductase